MSDAMWLVIGFTIGAVLCIIYEIASAYRRSRKTWFVPVGIRGEETVYQCRKCGGTFTCEDIGRMLYCPICGREVEDD